MSRIRSQLSYYDLTGGLNNVSTPDTLNSSPKKTESPDMVNVEFLKLGGIKSMEGNLRVGLNDVAKQSHPVIGGWEYTKNNNKYMIIALSNGDIRIYDATLDVPGGNQNPFKLIYHFPNTSDRVSFCNMNNGVVFTNGKDDPVFYEIGRKQQLTGTVTISSGSTAVTGSSTKFTDQLNPGDTVVIGASDTVYTIATITDDENLTLTTNATTSGSNLNIYGSEISQCNAVLTWDDSDTSKPSNWFDKTIRGTAIQYYAGRLWIGGKDGLFYSGLGEYNKWDVFYNDAGEISEVYNDTSDVKALGLYSDYMLVHK